MFTTIEFVFNMYKDRSDCKTLRQNISAVPQNFITRQ